MDIEQIIFILIAIGLSIFSMYKKAKSKQDTIPEEVDEQENYQKSYPQYEQDTVSQETDNPYYEKPIIVNYDTLYGSEYADNFTQKTPKTIKSKRLPQKPDFQTITTQNQSKLIDYQNDNEELIDFEGTELQKAFLYSEIIKKPNY